MKILPIIWVIVVLMIIIPQAMADNDFELNEKLFAKDAIEKFLNLSNLDIQLVGQLSTNSGTFEIYKSDTSFYYINSESNSVEGAVFLESPEQSKIVRLTPLDAQQNAQQFAIDHYNTFTEKNFQLIYAELIDHGDGGKEYLFIWREFIESTGTPNIVQISVNPESGKILSYTGIQRDVEVSVLPEITKDEAIDIAFTCFPKLSVQRESIPAYLSIEYITPRTQSLTWTVIIKHEWIQSISFNQIEYSNGGIVVIDAQTGKVLIKDMWR